MSPLRPNVVAAVLRKDVLILWPLALTALLAPLCMGFNASLDLTPQAKQVLMMVGGLAMAALLLTVIQQDGPANLRLDMRTRPVGLANLVTAKLLFLGLAVAAPLFAAGVINQRFLGHGWDEALLVGLSNLIEMVVIGIPVLVLAMVTSSLIQAGVVVFGMVIASVVLRLLFRDTQARGGADWVVDVATYAVVLVFCAAALVLLFRRKNPLSARMAWVVGAALVVLLAYFTPLSAVLAVQQAIAPRSEWEQKLALATSEPCLEVSGKRTADLSPQNLPAGWLMHVDRAVVRHRNAAGDIAAASKAKLVPEASSNTWRLSTVSQAREATGGTLEWRYDLTLLQPTQSGDLLADGRRRYIPHFGYCEASKRYGTVYVGCFKPSGQPAAFSASTKGLPAEQCGNCGSVNYRPAFLRVFSSRLSTISPYPNLSKSLPDQPVVTLTNYEARAHFTRHLVTSAPAKTAPVCAREG